MDADERETWRQADRILDGLLDLPPAERTARLKALNLPPALHASVRRLLAAHGQDAGPLDCALPARFAQAPEPQALIGRRLGRWQLQRELGRGGMAVVYRAQALEGATGQVAAIKILTLGALASVGRDRFLREQQALLRLRHPYIVPLYDAGVAEDGTPWLAMALVEGERIDHWCARHALDTEARVRLVLQVGEALSYAHRNLVIHRDIKPSNVLVDDDGHVRLLDFGIARLTDDADTEATATGLRALTPEYAAPEQFAGAPPSTVMDVYGLAALSYRLLTGKPPRAAHAGAAPPTLPSRAAAQAGEPAQRLRGDLDTVLMKALADAPEARYASVETFADDLRRWLQQRPVQARGPGWRYRTGRFVARHRLAVATALVGVVLGSAALTQIVVQRDRAEAQALRAETVRDFLADIFRSTEPDDGNVPDALDLLDQGSRRAREELLRRDPLVAADVLALSGGARNSLSDLEGAEADLKLALATLQRIEPAPARELSLVHHELGKLYRVRGPLSAELDHYRQAVVWQKRWRAPHEARIASEMSLASALVKTGRADEGEHMLRRLLAEVPEVGLAGTQQHIDVLNALSSVLAIGRRDLSERIPLHEQRLQVARVLYGPNDGWYAYTLADSVPTLRKSPAHIDRAEALAREAVAISERVYDKPHMFAAVAYCNYAALLLQLNRPEQAIAYYDRSIAIDEALSRNDRHAESCRYGRAHALAGRGRFDEAEADLDKGLAMLEKMGPAVTSLRLNNCGLRATVILRRRRTDEAVSLLKSCAVAATPDDIAKAFVYRQASAEAAWRRGDSQTSVRLLADLTRDRPPSPPLREWMQPWMLSVLAHASDPPALARLRAQLQPYAADPVLGRCLKQTPPEAAACLAL